jgi:HSP20 family protein
MANLTRWDPFGEMLSLRQAMDRLMEDAFVAPARRLGIGQGGEDGGLDLDLYEDDDAVVVTASLPGVKPEDVDVSVQGDVLTIRGETRFEQETERGRWHRRERRVGSFHRRIVLPCPVNTDGAEARFENGILNLRLPKAEEAKERKIRIESGARREIGQGGGNGGGDGGAAERSGASSSRRTGAQTGAAATGGTRTGATQTAGPSEGPRGEPEVVHGRGSRSG